MLWRANYITDTGKAYFLISLVVAADIILPKIFTDNAVKGAGFCSLPQSICPRYAILWDSTGTEYKIEYPFRPATPEWIEFWREIKANPLIIRSQGIGEIIKGFK